MRRLLLVAALLTTVAASATAEDRVQFNLDTSEADAVLAILNLRAASKPVSDANWQRLFTSEPYLRLKKREASMHRDFTDEDFKKFALSDDLAKQAPALQRTLDTWKRADLVASANRILPYLPSDARVKASVYP